MPEPVVAGNAASPAPTIEVNAPAAPVNGAPAANNENGNIAQLRTAYEGVKRDFEPWQKLGIKPEEAQRSHQFFQSVNTKATEIGSQLGYDAGDIAKALQEDPVGTLQFLQSKLAEQSKNQPPDFEKLITDKLNKAVGPLQQHFHVEKTNQANGRFDSEFQRLLGDSPYKEATDDEKGLLYDIVSENVKYDQEALKGLYTGESVAAVQKYFQEAQTRLDKYYSARSTAERNRVGLGGNKPADGANGAAKKPSLDEIIAGGGGLSSYR